MGNENIQRVQQFTYLGIVLDEPLSFEKHAKETINKTSTKILQLRKIRQYITEKAATLIYKNMILPIVEYGDIYIHSTTHDTKKKIQTLQNKALKCARGKDKRYDTQLLHKEASIATLRDRRKLHLLQHMYQISTHKNFLGWRRRTSTIVTRQNKKKLMKVAKPNSTRYHKSTAYQGPLLWNTLPLEIQKAESYPVFKSKLQVHLNKEKNKQTNQNS